MAFSVADLLQEQWRAFSLPQEHLAWAAQTQPAPALVLQQVVLGWTILAVFGGGLEVMMSGDVDQISSIAHVCPAGYKLKDLCCRIRSQETCLNTR